MIVLPFLLVFKEPDLGSALLLLPVGLAMMFVAGVPAAFLTRLLGGMAALIALVLVDILYAPKQLQLPVEEYQRRRLLVFSAAISPRPTRPRRNGCWPAWPSAATPTTSSRR